MVNKDFQIYFAT